MQELQSNFGDEAAFDNDTSGYGWSEEDGEIPMGIDKMSISRRSRRIFFF